MSEAGREGAEGGRGETPALRVRPIAPEDEPLLARFHAELSEQSVRLRYFAELPLKQRVLHNRLRRVCAADGQSELVLLAMAGARDEQGVAGVGRLSIDRLRAEGEVALLVADRHQGRGVGRALMERLVAAARERGLGRLSCFLLPENLAMRRLCARFGYAATADGDLVVARLELSPSSPGAPPCAPCPPPR